MYALRAPLAFDGEAFLSDGATVLFDGDQIRGVEGYGFPTPSDCTVASFDGTLLPGLIDTHTHLVGDSERDALDRVAGYSDAELETVVTAALRRQLAAGVTTVRDLGDRRFNVARRRHRDGEPTVVAAGPPLTSVGGHCYYLGGEVSGEEQIRTAIADRVDHAVDVVKVMASGGMTTPGTDQLGTQFSDADLRLVVDLAHAAGLPITAHAHALVAVRQAINAGVDGIEHCSCLTEHGPTVDPELFDRIAAAGIVVCATSGGDVTKLGPPPPHIQALMERMGTTPEQVFGERAALLRQLHESGVTLVAGVYSGINHVKAHGIIGLGIAEHLRAGIPSPVVLAGATALAANACGLGLTKGRLRTGYDADLVVVGTDPRTDPAAITDIRAVVLRGQSIST
jgi:imidazolonepropionase-like amidohydrolase